MSLAAAVRQEVSSQDCSVVTGLNTSSISHNEDKELKCLCFHSLWCFMTVVDKRHESL